MITRMSLLMYFLLGWYFLNAGNLVGLDASALQADSTIVLNRHWMSFTGDTNPWPDQVSDSSNWSTLPTTSELDPDWSGNGWFRMHLDVDSLLVNQPIGVNAYFIGELEVYLNEKPIHRFIQVRDDKTNQRPEKVRIPRVIVFDRPGENTLWACYTFDPDRHYGEYGFRPGFTLILGNYESLSYRHVQNIRSLSMRQALFLFVPLALALLHFFLFIFEPTSQKNIFYVLFLICFTGFINIYYQNWYSNDLDEQVFLYRLSLLALVTSVLFASMTIYAFFARLPRYFYGYVALAFIIGLAGFFYPGKGISLAGYAFIMAVSINGGWHLFSPRARSGIGVWIIRTGFVIMAISGIYQMLLALGIIQPILQMYLAYFYGVLAFIISMSISLAYDYAQTARDLRFKLVEVEELSRKALEEERRARVEEAHRQRLEAENARRSQEMEDARQLQLSMLPTRVPQMDHLDIAVHIQTASEVGGDYYDFHVDGPDSLSIAIGDATGHGLRAGTMVAAIKSLFTAFVDRLPMNEFFRECTRIIKRMNLGNLYMAMLLVRIEGRRLRTSSAGMPPIFVYRVIDASVEEWINRGIPLGGPVGPEYQIKEIDLSPNDVVLLMSDGLPELFNESHEQLDYERIKQAFRESAEGPAERIVDHLVALGQEWRGKSQQNDDITIMVIKVK